MKTTQLRFYVLCEFTSPGHLLSLAFPRLLEQKRKEGRKNPKQNSPAISTEPIPKQLNQLRAVILEMIL